MDVLEFPFEDSPNTAAFTCCHVMDRERPILFVSHDDDGYWQFLCGDKHTKHQARIVSMMSVYLTDKSIGALSGLDYGQRAERQDINSEWVIER